MSATAESAPVIPAGRLRSKLIAGLAGGMIVLHLGLRLAPGLDFALLNLPLLVALAFGGFPLVRELGEKLWRREFGSDLLAGISIVTSVILGEYLAGAIVVLMLSGGEALESYAVSQASSVLGALAKRMPSVAHRQGETSVADVALDEIVAGDRLLVYPHEVCPVDGVVTAGNGAMNEAFLTGEPYVVTKAPGSEVISGAINGEAAITIRATRRAVDSRYARIMEVMRESSQTRPKLRRLGDQLGALYTPLALVIAGVAWAASGEAARFLAVLVVATPCPLLIAIPVAIIGAISLAARRSIIIKNPAVLEQIAQCRTAIFDKTGTLTYGEPRLSAQDMAPGLDRPEVLGLVASLELYSKHPLARAILAAAKAEGLRLGPATEVSEPPGQGLRGIVAGRSIQITNRGRLARENPGIVHDLPPGGEGLECLALIDGRFAARFRFRDQPRAEGSSFVRHLGPKHQFDRIMIVSGDREPEVRHLAAQVGIQDLRASQSPEQKLAIVRAETERAKTLYIGDGVNDAPAMMAATVGMALGQNCEVTTEAADVVIMDSSLQKVDEFMHLSRRMRVIALQSAVGGIALSLGGMLLAATGHLSPVQGAVLQEVIDVLAVLNALRAAFPPAVLSDLS